MARRAGLCRDPGIEPVKPVQNVSIACCAGVGSAGANGRSGDLRRVDNSGGGRSRSRGEWANAENGIGLSGDVGDAMARLLFAATSAAGCKTSGDRV